MGNPSNQEAVKAEKSVQVGVEELVSRTNDKDSSFDTTSYIHNLSFFHICDSFTFFCINNIR